MTRRRSLSTKARVEFFLSRGGQCASCGMKCDRGWDLDHEIPLAMGGADEPSNWVVLCRPCHRAKTRGADVPAIAKAKRREAYYLGVKVSRSPLPYGRRSRWKKRLDGTVVRRTP